MKTPLALASRAALAAALVAVLPACQRDLPPDATYRALVRAAADRDEAAAWNQIGRAHV